MIPYQNGCYGQRVGMNQSFYNVELPLLTYSLFQVVQAKQQGAKISS